MHFLYSNVFKTTLATEIGLVKLVIGSRGSKLALIQTHWVRDLLLAQGDGLDVEVLEIRTTGDSATGSLRSFGGAGVFTTELERALLERQIDLAVHSLKDLPTDMHPDLALIATPEREDVRDALIGPELTALDDLPTGARIGTGSLRRQAQLKALRPDLNVVDLRGNIDRDGDQAACVAVQQVARRNRHATNRYGHVEIDVGAVTV